MDSQTKASKVFNELKVVFAILALPISICFFSVSFKTRIRTGKSFATD